MSQKRELLDNHNTSFKHGLISFKCGKCDSVHISDINYVQNYTFSALEPNLILLILKANI